MLELDWPLLLIYAHDPFSKCVTLTGSALTGHSSNIYIIIHCARSPPVVLPDSLTVWCCIGEVQNLLIMCHLDKPSLACALSFHRPLPSSLLPLTPPLDPGSWLGRLEAEMNLIRMLP